MPRSTKQERAALLVRARETAEQEQEQESPHDAYDDAPVEAHMARVKRTTDTIENQKHVRRCLTIHAKKQ